MNRRTAVRLAALVLGMPALLLAQTARRFRVGCLWFTSEENARSFVEAFLAGLQDLGYVGGRNLVLDMRYADGESGRLSALADELIALKPDVLVGIELAAIVMRTRTSTIPIVLPTSTDPVASGLVQSLARPGTNVTGLTSSLNQVVAKHIELLTEIVPNMSRVALLNDPAAPAAASFEQFARTAAVAKDITLIVADASGREQVRKAFAAFEKSRPQGIVVATTGRTAQHRREIIAHSLRMRLPAVSALPGDVWAEAGGLISYGANTLASFRYAASYVDRILKGAKPADLPVEQSGKFEFVVNLKTAAGIGVTIPRSILLRADRVIE